MGAISCKSPLFLSHKATLFETKYIMYRSPQECSDNTVVEESGTLE